MGHHSRKVLAYGTRMKTCRKCMASDKIHQCRRNFDKSAKAMEADLAFELATKNELFDAGNVELGVLVGDEDSSTMASIRVERPDIIKWSDLNHIKKGFNNALYKLQNRHKVLQTKVIKYLKRCFSYVVAQNKGNSHFLKEALLNIPEHVFGNHENCGDWCRHKLDPSAKYTRLPRGNCLSGDSLKSDLHGVFLRFANNSEKIAPCGSTQANESFNAIVATKAPKSRFYGGSDSLDFRVACAVSQTNFGASYIVPVNKKLGLSPGSQTQKFRGKYDQLREKSKARKGILAFKKRRMELANKRANNSYVCESKEGKSYESNMGLRPENNSSVKVLPLHVLSVPETDDIAFVFFDVETTGVSSNATVIQIAALHEGECYNAYIMPNSISEKVTDITGLSKAGNHLLLEGKVVDTISRHDAWGGLVNFLLEIQKKIVLVGHNVGFDMRFLLKEASEVKLDGHISLLVHGFIDTLKVCREAFPGRSNYKQSEIANDLAVTIGAAHNAVSDVMTLQAIVAFVEEHILIKHLKLLPQFLEEKNEKAAIKANKESLLPLKDFGVSAIMIGKLASLGISLCMLDSAFKVSGELGLSVHVEKVTKNKKIIVNMAKYFHR
jgi:DNA polymerase III epsilon subunit-like protein